MTSHEDLFFTQTGMERRRVQDLVDKTLHGADDGELFLEYRQTESFAFDDGRLKAATYDTTQGFGLRAVAGEATGYAHASELSEAAIARAADAVSVVKLGHSGELSGAPARTNIHLYTDESPLDSAGFNVKVKLMGEIDAYARKLDPRVKQVSCSLAGEWQAEAGRGPAPGSSMSDVTPKSIIEVDIAARLKAKPELLKEINSTYEFNITGPTGGQWHLDVTEASGGVVTAGAKGDAKCVVTVGDADFVKIVKKETNAQMAFMSGKLKVKGDMGLALKLTKLLG